MKKATNHNIEDVNVQNNIEDIDHHMETTDRGGSFSEKSSKSIAKIKSNLSGVIASLMMVFMPQACDVSADRVGSSAAAAIPFVTAFNHIEKLDTKNIVHALDIIQNLVLEIKNNPDFRSYIGPDGSALIDESILFALSIPETRANIHAKGGIGEQGLFQIRESTQNYIIQSLEKLGAQKESIAMVEKDYHLAGALSYGNSLNRVSKLMKNGKLDKAPLHEKLKIGYVIHNMGYYGFKRHFLDQGYRSWDDFSSSFYTMLSEEGFYYEDWKREIQIFNQKKENEKRQKKINKIVWLQSVRKDVKNPQLKRVWNAFLSGHMMGLSYNIMQEVTTK